MRIIRILKLRFRPLSQTILIFMLFFPPLVFSQPLRLSGYFKFFAHPNLNPPYPLDRFGSRLQLGLSHSVADRANFYVAFDFNLEERNTTGLDNEPRSAMSEIYPVEAYLDLHWTRADLRLGKQFIFWGRTDWINPTDNITPWDFQNITAEIEDYRIPVSALKFDVYLGKWQFQQVLVPVFKPNRVPVHFPKSMGGYPVLQPPAHTPDSRLKNWQYGMRVSSYWQGFDFAFSYWQGFDLFPSIHVSVYSPSNSLPQAIIFQQQFHRQSVFGFDFAKVFHRIGIKGEGAYFRTRDPSGKNIFIKNPWLQYVLGLDYNATDKLALNFQFVQEILLKYSRRYEYLQRRRQGEPNPDVPNTDTNSLSGRIQYTLSDSWNMQAVSVFNLAHRDFFLLPILTYNFADGLNLYAGATIFAGPGSSPFGRNKRYSRAFFEIKYSY